MSRVDLKAGDRVIVRTLQPIDPEAATKLRKSIERWAGCELRILIVDSTKMEIDY